MLLKRLQRKLTVSVTVLARSYTARDSERCWAAAECCWALEAAVFVVVALRYVTSILKMRKLLKF